MKAKPNLRHFLTNKLRRASYQWSPRREAISAARVSRGKYKCASCGGEDFGPGDIQCDHIEPVIDPHVGFVNWDEFINRLFCGVTGYQILCFECHKYKSLRENLVRSQVKLEKEPEEDI